MSDTEIDHPSVLEADILVAMSQPAFDRYVEEVTPDAFIIIDSSYVLNHGEEVYGVEATRIAEQAGTRIVSNMVMTSVVSEILGLPRDALKKAVEKTLPPSTHRINFVAIEEGFKEGERIKGLKK